MRVCMYLRRFFSAEQVRLTCWIILPLEALMRRDQQAACRNHKATAPRSVLSQVQLITNINPSITYLPRNLLSLITSFQGRQLQVAILRQCAMNFNATQTQHNLQDFVL
jgi:hypothetical protein